jgi:hypothetical protein
MNQDGWNYQVRVEEGYVHTVFRGQMSPAAMDKAIADSAMKAKTYDDKRVLFDFCNVQFSSDYVAESLAQTALARELGIDPGFRLAFFSDSSPRVMQQIESVALSRGYTAKAFSNRDQAIAWLKSR